MLIPQIENPTNFTQMQPAISTLCFVAYKIFCKTLVNRLALLLSKIILKEQGAFIKGQSIQENISVAQELIQSINAKVREKN